MATTDGRGMNKSKLASWIVAGALALGSGIAMAETAPENPELVGDPEETTTTTAADEPTTTTTVAETTTTTVDGGETDGDDTEGDSAKERPDNHGKVVSEAARDRSRDEEFGNHGKYVSSVARGDDASEAKNKAKGGKPAKGSAEGEED